MDRDYAANYEPLSKKGSSRRVTNVDSQLGHRRDGDNDDIISRTSKHNSRTNVRSVVPSSIDVTQQNSFLNSVRWKDSSNRVMGFNDEVELIVGQELVVDESQRKLADYEEF